MATQDHDFRQASVPPTITVMMDIPGYGVKGMNKWEEYIEDNLKVIDEARQEDEKKRLKIYKDRLNRIGLLQNAIDEEA